MFRSMTGFGQAVAVTKKGSIHVEVKTLNSKFLDVGLRIPSILSEKEIDVRTLIQDQLERGKISVNVEYRRSVQEEISNRYNEDTFIQHYGELKKLADRVMAPYDGLFELALKSPDVGAEQEDKESPEALEQFVHAVVTAINQCNDFRHTEGTVLAEKLTGYIHSVELLLERIEKLDPLRIEKIRSRIRKNVTDFFGEEGFDGNRLEQEILFYIEKLDIHEERVRLRTHLSYFLEVMKEPRANGKKLGFIAQEIGREINTIGSKANDAEMQKNVIMMKEELEKVKEQLSNVL